MRRRQKQTVKKVAIGSGLAAAAGYIAGVLTAPKSGKDTRDDIFDAAENGKVDLEKEFKAINKDLSAVIDDAKKKSAKANKKSQAEIKGMIEKSLDTKEKVKELIGAIHDGSAEDEDLKRAVKNANNAVEHLKDYLKK
jgi:gas vesicle protein